MNSFSARVSVPTPVLTGFKEIPYYFLQPIRLFQTYNPKNLRFDLIAGLTVAVVLLPQGIAYALIAELPPEVGLYAAVVAAIVGALWGSSNQLQNGPTNAISLLILSTLSATAASGAVEFAILAGMMAVMVGVIQLVMGLARLGMLVNFVSHSVIVGFSSGAGVLIAIKQAKYLFGIEFSSHGIVENLEQLVRNLPQIHWITFVLGFGVILLILLLNRIAPKMPGPLLGMAVAATFVGLFGLDKQGVSVIGQLPRSLPPLAKLPLLNFELIGELSAGAVAVAAIGLVEAMSISRSIAAQTGQRLDSNQEFVGQGVANIVTGLFSGYPGSGSFTRSAVNFKAGAKTPLASAFSGVFVLVAMFILAPLAVFVPRTALAAVLIVIAYGMIEQKEMLRIWHGARADALIMIVTFFATLFLEIEVAVLTGIFLSFAVYIMKTSVPKITSVLPDDSFKHFAHQPEKPACPQLGILDISGDLYFGAVSHFEKGVLQHMAEHPEQRFLLLRMHRVNQCDFSGIHALEGVVRACRDRQGDVFMVRVQPEVMVLMKTTGFYRTLGADHFKTEDKALIDIFYKTLDPAICVYECEVRAFLECQNLPKQIFFQTLPLHTDIPPDSVKTILPAELRLRMSNGRNIPYIVDVREPREFRQGHIPEARLLPLPKLLLETVEFPPDRLIVCVCRGGRRSLRAAYILQQQNIQNVSALAGGMLAWAQAGFLEAIDN